MRPIGLEVLERRVGPAEIGDVAGDEERDDPLRIGQLGPAQEKALGQLVHPDAGPRKRMRRRLAPEVSAATANPIRNGFQPVRRIA